MPAGTLAIEQRCTNRNKEYPPSCWEIFAYLFFSFEIATLTNKVVL